MFHLARAVLYEGNADGLGYNASANRGQVLVPSSNTVSGILSDGKKKKAS